MRSKKLRPGLCPMKPVRTCNRNCAHPMTSYCKPHPKPVKKYYIDLMDSELVRAHRCGPLKLSLSGPSTPAVALAAGISTAIPATAYDLKHRQCKRLQICAPWKAEGKLLFTKQSGSFLPIRTLDRGLHHVLPLWPPDRGEQDRDGTGYSLDGVTPDTSRTVACHGKEWLQQHKHNTCAGAPLSAGQMPFFYQTESHLSTTCLCFYHFTHSPISLSLCLAISSIYPSACLFSLSLSVSRPMSMFHACIWKNVSQNMARN